MLYLRRMIMVEAGRAYVISYMIGAGMFAIVLLGFTVLLAVDFIKTRKRKKI
jgi:hypothetical protein